jgi:hypothetical protein
MYRHLREVVHAQWIADRRAPDCHCVGFATNTPAQAAGRSFEECQQIALARGLRYATPPKRYTMLKGHGHKTNPQGMMARCMAGL